MKLSKKTQRDLDRLIVLTSLDKSNGSYDWEADTTIDEYSTLIESIADEFAPLVRQLVASGVLTVRVALDEDRDASQYCAVTGKPNRVYREFGLVIDSEQHMLNEDRKVAILSEQSACADVPDSGTLPN